MTTGTHADLTTIAKTDITGLLLAGGMGRRMGGSDKGLLELAGLSMAARVLERLRPQVGSLLINANRSLEIWHEFGNPVIGDTIGGFSGPLAGIHAGLIACPTPWLVTAPCDSPFLPHDLVARLAAAASSAAAELAVVRSEGQLQPVFLLVNHNALPGLAAFLAEGGRKIDSWIARQKVVVVDFEDGSAFANINTPEELAAADLRMARYQSSP